MKCPKCRSPMESVVYENIEVKRCTQCRGIWFAASEMGRLKDIRGSESIDTGDPKIGRKYNKLPRTYCPNCNVMMVRMVDREQPHIWYEMCGSCYGTFLDAGEFTDLKQETVTGSFKRLFVRERK